MSDFFDIDTFEAASKQNGMRYWIAHEFMEALGYESYASFSQVINKAISSCVQLGIQIPEAFETTVLDYNGKQVNTYKLSRFACFLVAMHADSKKPQVAKAKTALAAVADALVQQALDQSSLARLETREDLKSGEKIMAAVAKNAGLEDSKFGLFKDAGFRGMYNMSLADLKAHKGLKDPKAVLYDFMGLTELAGNLFRVTQTAERIKSQNIKGSISLTSTARDVGKEVRSMMIKNSGSKPENLQIEENIHDVKKQLKSANREMKKIDKPKK
ncbi:hypothetical protein LIN78_12020 [Leeia sp. TBRC 13508]|uniref:Bro-N domain-containing protein n=1 Tax=Leeia speluncae TaxID=2884804 RepID=A0ABS8D8K0_9NEIS|nr:BRO family protein [Leeia speluncae]MCB6184271.1 hypothetical protein [Leeia speluncae]